MDLFSLGFLILILLVSGGIAFAADRLGKKLGKKRLSLRLGRFSVRPKHVASLGTAGMGVIVSFLTILFIALVSRDAREWLGEGRRLLIQREELKRENRHLEGQIATRREQNDLLERQFKELKGRYDSQRAQLARLDEKVTNLNTDLKRSQGDLARTRGELARSQGQLAGVRRELPPLRRSIESARAQAAVAQADLNAARRKLTTTQSGLQTATKNLDYALKRSNDAYKKSLETYRQAQDLQKQVDALEAQRKTQEDLVAKLQRDTADLVEQRNDAEAKATEARTRYAEVQARLEQARQELAELQGIAQQQYLFLATTFRASRVERLTFRAGEELARFPLPGGSRPEAAANALASLLRAARLEATARGAKGNRRGDHAFEVADVFERTDDKTGATLSGDDLKRAIVARAAGQFQDQVLVATSSLNAFAGEPVSLEIAVVPNPVVYRRNDMVAEARIDGSQDEDRILEQISTFVRDRVRERARQDRMIPRQGTDAPFGEVRTGEVLALVREVKRVGRSVRVQALAEGDTHAADPLRLEFRVR